MRVRTLGTKGVDARANPQLRVGGHLADVQARQRHELPGVSTKKKNDRLHLHNAPQHSHLTFSLELRLDDPHVAKGCLVERAQHGRIAIREL